MKVKEETPEPGINTRYVYIKPTAKFYDTQSGILMPANALNQSEWGDTKNKTATSLFKAEGGDTVDGLGWMPCAANTRPDRIITLGRKICVNTYECPPVIEPSEGADVDLWLKMMAHIVPAKKERDVYIDHMAATIQHPERKVSWHPLNYGAFRVGKDAVLKPLVIYLGSLVSEISNEMSVAGWGDTRAKKKMLIFAEVLQPGDKGFENSLKLLAAPTASGVDTLNLKGGAVIQQPNLYSIYAMSNHTDCMHLSAGDARWFVIDSFDIEKRPKKDYVEYFEWLESGGWKDVIAWLLARDLSAFSWGCLPYQTDAYMRLVSESRSTIASVLAEKIETNERPFTKDIISVMAIYDWLREDGYRVKVSILKKELTELGCVDIGQGQKWRDGKNDTTPRLMSVRDHQRYENLDKKELHRLWEKTFFSGAVS